MDAEYMDLLFLVHHSASHKYNNRNKFSPLIAMPDVQFRREYRMSKESFRKMNAIISPLITGSDVHPDDENQYESYRSTMPKYKKLLVTLKYLACGNFHYDTGSIEAYSAAQVCRVVKEVAPAIASLCPLYIKFPTDDERRRVSMSAGDN